MATTRPYLGRSGTTGVSWLLLAISATATLVAVVAPAYRLAHSGGYVTVMRGDIRTGVDEHLRAGAHAVSSGEMVTLAVDHIPAGLRVLNELSTSLTAVAVAAGAWWLAQVLRTIRAGRPFDRRNPLRLAGLAAAVVLGGTASPLLGGFVNDLVVRAVKPFPQGAPLNTVVLDLHLVPIVLGVVVLAAAEAFRRGRVLADDVDGLV